MLGLKESYQQLWKAVIRPERMDYDELELGEKIFLLQNRPFVRTDYTLDNNEGLTLKCSHYEPKTRPCKQLPCVIYCHANSSSRLGAKECIETVLLNFCTLFTFDFAGSGLSEGKYISLGYYEKEDLAEVI